MFHAKTRAIFNFAENYRTMIYRAGIEITGTGETFGVFPNSSNPVAN